MSAEDKFILRCGGFAVVFLGALSLLFLWGFFMALKQGPGHTAPFLYYMGLVIMAGLPAYFLYFLLVQRIEINGDGLRVLLLFGPGIRPREWSVRLSEIDEIVFGPIGQLKKDHALMAAPRLRETIGKYESMRTTSQGLSVSMRPAVQFTPLIVIKTKDVAKSQVIITKPFSRRGGRTLMAAFRNRGIKVTGDEKL